MLISEHYSRLYSLFLLKVDFEKEIWLKSMFHAKKWLLICFILDIFAQITANRITTTSVVFSLLTPLSFWWLRSPRLIYAAGYLYSVQAIISIFLWCLLSALQPPELIGIGTTYLWQFWCIAATVNIILMHIRTKK